MPLKITDAHYDILQRAVQALIDNKPLSRAEYEDAGLSAKRWRWDSLFAAGVTDWVCNVLYKYLDDDHIDSALRRITGAN